MLKPKLGTQEITITISSENQIVWMLIKLPYLLLLGVILIAQHFSFYHIRSSRRIKHTPFPPSFPSGSAIEFRWIDVLYRIKHTNITPLQIWSLRLPSFAGGAGGGGLAVRPEDNKIVGVFEPEAVLSGKANDGEWDKRRWKAPKDE